MSAKLTKLTPFIGINSFKKHVHKMAPHLDNHRLTTNWNTNFFNISCWQWNDPPFSKNLLNNCLMRELVVFTEFYFIHSGNTSKLLFRLSRNLTKNILFNNFECIYRDNGKCGITRKKENSNARTNVLKELLLEILLVLQTTLRANDLWPLLWLDTTEIENETSGNALT